MIVFGAIDFAAAVARIGSFLGYRVTVCDARSTFATAKRFPDADEVVVEWPHRYLARAEVDERTVVCVLTHDPKFDIPLLEVALRTPLAYLGAMGSRRTNEDRVHRLKELAERMFGRRNCGFHATLCRAPFTQMKLVNSVVLDRREMHDGVSLAATVAEHVY